MQALHTPPSQSQHPPSADDALHSMFASTLVGEEFHHPTTPMLPPIVEDDDTVVDISTISTILLKNHTPLQQHPPLTNLLDVGLGESIRNDDITQQHKQVSSFNACQVTLDNLNQSDQQHGATTTDDCWGNGSSSYSRSTVVAYAPNNNSNKNNVGFGGSTSSFGSSMGQLGEILGDDGIVALGQREKEVSCVGGARGSSSGRSAQKHAKRERRQKAKEGDVEIAFAGSVEMSNSYPTGGGIKEIVFLPPKRHSGGARRESVENNEWVAPLINLMGAGGGVSNTTDGGGIASKRCPVPTATTKRHDLRSGKKNLLSGWCNDIQNQKRDTQITNWIDLVPAAVPDVSPHSSSTAVVPENTRSFNDLLSGTTRLVGNPTTSSPFDFTTRTESTNSFVSCLRSVVNSCRSTGDVAGGGDDDSCDGGDCKSRVRSTSYPQKKNETQIISIPSISTTSSTRTPSHTRDVSHTVTMRHNDDEVSTPIASMMHSLGSLGSGTHVTHDVDRYYEGGGSYHTTKSYYEGGGSYHTKQHLLHPDDDHESRCISGGTGIRDTATYTPEGFPSGSAPSILIEHLGNSNLLMSGGGRGGDITTMIPSSPRLSRISELTGTASYPLDEGEGSSARITGGASTPPSSAACVTLDTYDYGDSDQQIVSTLGCISTQHINQKSCINRKSTTSAVSLNECVYNLEHWDEDEFGCFVVPTDNITAIEDDIDASAVSCYEGEGGGGGGEASHQSGPSPLSLFSLARDEVALTVNAEEVSAFSVKSPSSSLMKLAGFPSTPLGLPPVSPRLQRGGGSALRLSVASISSTQYNNNNSFLHTSPTLSPQLQFGGGNSSITTRSASDVLAAFFTAPSGSPTHIKYKSVVMSDSSTSPVEDGVVSGGSPADYDDVLSKRSMLCLGDVVMGESFCSAPQFGASQSLGRAPSPSTFAYEHSQQLKALVQHHKQKSGEFGTSSILVDSTSRRWGEGSSLKSAGSTVSSTTLLTQTTTSTNYPQHPSSPIHNMNLSVNTSPRRPSSSRFLFSEVVTSFNVIVDTLTHGASNHTLQLAQPLTGDSARNYRRNEARMQPSPQHEQLSELHNQAQEENP